MKTITLLLITILSHSLAIADNSGEFPPSTVKCDSQGCYLTPLIHSKPLQTITIIGL